MAGTTCTYMRVIFSALPDSASSPVVDVCDVVVAIYLIPIVQLCINLYISAQLLRWFLWSVDCVQVVYNTVYLYPRLRREAERARERWNERPSPPFRSDVFSFLYHDIMWGRNRTWIRPFYAIMCAVKQEQLAYANGRMQSPWWELLPGRILQSFSPRNRRS